MTMISYSHLKMIINDFRFHMFSWEIIFLSSSDEVFYHTVLRNILSEKDLELDFCFLFTKWSKFRSGSPDDLSIDLIPEMIEDNGFFARKIKDMNVLIKIQEAYNTYKKQEIYLLILITIYSY